MPSPWPKTLSRHQEEILAYLADQTEPTTLNEIGAARGFDMRNIPMTGRALEAHGLIEVVPDRTRVYADCIVRLSED